jgi:hypothetical protein
VTAAELKAKVVHMKPSTRRRRAKTLVLKKNEDRDVLKVYVRNLKNKHIDYSDAVSDPDRERLRDKTPAPKSRPDSAADLRNAVFSRKISHIYDYTEAKHDKRRFTRRSTKTPKVSWVREATLSEQLYRKALRERSPLWTATGNFAYHRTQIQKRILLAVMSFTAVEK